VSTPSENPKCYICGSSEIAPSGSPGSTTCAACAPVRQHVVAMQTGAGGSSLAICPCGWSSEIPWKGHHAAQDVAVRQHWRAVIEASAPT